MKIINFLSLCAFILSFHLAAMELHSSSNLIQKIKPKEKPFINIINHTEDSLQVAFKYKSTEEQVLCVEPFNTLKLPKMMKIESLYVVIYGKWVKFSNRSYFTFGLVGPSNLIQDKNMNAFIASKQPVQIKVTSSGKTIVESLSSNTYLKKVAEFISPYSFQFTAAQEKPIEKEPDGFFLFDNFPRVKRAFRTDQEIHERYFLDLPQGATEISELKAYERVRDQWTQVKETSKDPARIKLAEDALKLVDAAWTSLSLKDDKSISDFKALVYAEEQFPTSYFFEQEPWTEEVIANWIEMGGTYEPQNKGAGAPSSQQNNNN